MPQYCSKRRDTESSLADVVARLRDLGTFGDLDEDELTLVVAASTPVRATAGVTLVHQHSSSDGVFILLSGTVDVIMICERVAIVPEGGVVGQRPALGDDQRAASLMAGTDAELLHIPGPEFTSLLAACPQAAARLEQLVTTHVGA